MNQAYFDNLNTQEAQVLGFLAFASSPITKSELGYYLAKISRPASVNLDGILKKLCEKKLVIRINDYGYWSHDSYAISNALVIPVNSQLQKIHPEWLPKYDKVLPKRYEDRNLIKCIQLLCGVNSSAPCQFPELDYKVIAQLAKFAMYLVGDAEYESLIQSLPKEVICQMISLKSFDSINNDGSDDLDSFLSLLDIIPDKLLLPSGAFSVFSLAYFLQKGRRLDRTDHSLSDRWTLLLDAVEAMQHEDYDTALNLFQKAQGGNLSKSFHFSSSLWFDQPIVNFLYCLTFLKKECENSDSIETFLNSFYSGKLNTLAAEILVKSFCHDSYDKPINSLSKLLYDEENEYGVNLKLAKILAVWHGITDAEIRKSNRSVDYHSESIVYNGFAVQMADRILNSFTVKAKWEKAIELLLQSELEGQKPLVASDSKSDTLKTERIAYFVSANFRQYEIREQSRLKSGVWSSGRKISDSTFAYYSDDKLDQYDQKVKQLYRKLRYITPTVHDILPLLVGSDKLYLGNSAPYICCQVREEKPFLSTKVTGDSISVSCNVPASQLSDKEEDHLLYSFVETTPKPDKAIRATQVRRSGIVSLYRVPLRDRNILSILTSVGSFPLQAEEKLRQLLDLLKSHIEIHSEMIEGGSSLPQVEADSRIFVQALPIGGDYQVQALLRPLPNGQQMVLPGRGENNIYDQTADGTRYQVVRNKNLEKKRIKPLVEFMEQADCTETSPYVWRIDPYQLLELLEWLPEQDEDTFVVEWPEGQRIQLSTTNPQHWNISLKQKGDWFEVEGEIPIDDKTALSVMQLLDLLNDGKGRFIRLENGQYLRLTDSLRRQLRRLDSVAQNVRGKTRISRLGAGLIADYLDGDITISHPASIDKLRQSIRASEQLQADVPDALNAVLRDYQEEGFRWIDRLSSWGAGACLADDMGLGKTVQTIAYLLHRQSHGPSLVVAPASVVPNWKKELARFAPTLNATVLNDLPGDLRSKAIAETKAGDVVITTYGLLISLEEAMVEKSWNVVCLDEAHSIKNASTKSSAVCMQLQASSRLILTGTPIQNHLGELWNLFQFINPGLLGSFEQFTKKFINPIEAAHDKERQQQLKRLVQPFMLRRTKQEVVAELPDKQEINLPVQLNAAEMSIYETLRLMAKSQLEADEAEGNGSASVNALAMITKLRMASCAASLAEKNWTGTSSKLEAFADLVSEVCTEGNHILVFSQFTSFLEMARQQLEQRGITDYLYLDGSTTLKRRSEMVEKFQSGQASIFLISLKAGGLGLNLTRANYVIHLDPWWNPAIEQQATDRAYRIGQQQKVTVYHLISEHTIEEKIVRLHQTKRDLADSLLEGSDMSHKLSASDLLNMLNETKFV